MSKPLVGRRGGKRVILWWHVGARALDVVLAVVVLFLLTTCVVGASHEGPFFETWWGGHLFVLFLGFLVLPLLAVTGLPLFRWLQRPPHELPDLDASSGDASAQDPAGRRVVHRGLAAVVGVAILVLLVALFYVEENARGERAWNRYKRELEARGERLDPAALVPPPVPDDQNFAATPSLAPLFDFLPGTQRPRDPVALDRTRSLSPAYEAASSHVKPRTVTRSSTWVSLEIDLPAWCAAFRKGTNAVDSAGDIEAGRAFRLRYGLSPAPTGAMASEPSTLAAQPSTNPPTRAEAAAVVLDALDDCEPVLEELRGASRRPYSRFNLRYDLPNPSEIHLPHYAALKRTVQVLQLRAAAELALGRNDKAAEDIQFMFRLADSIRNEPMIIAHQVRLAIVNIALQPLGEGLARHQWSGPQLREFEERLRGFDFLADARQALQGERIVFTSGVIDYVRRSPDKYRLFQIGLGFGNGQPSEFQLPSALMAVVPGGWFYLEKRNCHRNYQDYLLPAIDVQGRQVSPEACRRAVAHFEALSQSSWPGRVLRHQFFCAMLLPGLSHTVEKTAMLQTGVDCAAAACALERFRLAHGQWPETLGALVPEFIPQLPHDLINGQPLSYLLTADGQYVLYSVGWNGTDDGGALGMRQDGKGLDNATGDWVWQLPAGS